LPWPNTWLAFKLGFRSPLGSGMRTNLPTFVKVWFVLDLLLAWFPPLHWAASGADPLLFGVPRSLCYIIGVDFFVVASVIVAYFYDDLSTRQD
jgi:hypothetical protein